MRPALCTSKHHLFPEDPQVLTFLTDYDKFAGASFGIEDRATCEKDLSLLQPLPYVTVVDPNTGKIYIYARGEGGGEAKLFGNCSIGLGGHIETEPSGLQDIYDVITNNVLDELHEEVGLVGDGPFAAKIDQLLHDKRFEIFYDPTNEVGQYHLCLSIILQVDPVLFGQAEAGIIEKGRWMSVGEIEEAQARGEFNLENWSKIVLPRLTDRGAFDVPHLEVEA